LLNTDSVEHVLLLGGLAVEEALTVDAAVTSDLSEVLLTGLLGLAEKSLAILDLLDAAGLDGGGDQSLDLGGFEASLLAVLLDLAANDELADVILASLFSPA